MTTTITRLPGSDLPWRYALRVVGVDSDTFHLLIASLKSHISPRDRKWDAAQKCWLLRDCDLAIWLLNQFSIPYECDTAQDAPRTTALTTVEAYQTLFLQPGAPDFLIQAVYRALAKKLHPDAGGDTAEMQKVNRAMEVLR